MGGELKITFLLSFRKSLKETTNETQSLLKPALSQPGQRVVLYTCALMFLLWGLLHKYTVKRTNNADCVILVFLFFVLNHFDDFKEQCLESTSVHFLFSSALGYITSFNFIHKEKNKTQTDNVPKINKKNVDTML